MRRSQQVAALGEEPQSAPAAVLEARAPARHGEAHVGGLGLDADLREQPDQIGIGSIVVHQKARVERQRSARAFGDNRVSVTPEAFIFLEQMHLVTTAEEIGRRQT